MESDDLPARGPDLLAQITRQDLDPLSVVELEARVAALEGEIARTRSKIAAATSRRSAADALFRR